MIFWDQARVIAFCLFIGVFSTHSLVQAGDDLLEDEAPIVVKLPEKKPEQAAATPTEDPHAALLSDEKYPSATQCATCHRQIYDEWSSSNHAYAAISPMFHKFEDKINGLAQGTVAGFCVRCHISAGTAMNEPREMPIWDRAPVSREGVTCITCHRVKEVYTRVNGERRIEPGEIHEPVFGTGDGKALDEVIDKKDYYKVAPTKAGPGVPVHQKAVKFEEIGKSEFCLTCHQVAVHPGIKLEVVWDQYRASPALKSGTTCQDCHMGKEPGVASGYETGAAAIVNGTPINPNRKRSNHNFYGPGYTISHPGIFPQNPKAESFKIKEWLTFDYRTNWGKPEFEKEISSGKQKAKFPAEWESVDDRISARRIVDENLKLLEKKKELRRRTMENGTKVTGPFFADAPKVGKDLKFRYQVTNTNPGHHLPSGSLGAQPEIWLNVALTGPDGKNLWESGYMDSFGDVADNHSQDVQYGKLAFDEQLVNFQTKFLTANIKGTEREMYLPINLDVDQIPFIRPANAPNSVLNHPNGVRMEARSITPLGSRAAKYTVPSHLLEKAGKYKLSFRVRSRAEPIYFMRFVGATQDMQQAMNEWMLDYHTSTVEFDVK
jgi:hypothetical protein